MFAENNFITIRQLKLLLILDIFGMGITILPQRAVKFGGQNGWALILIGLIFSIFFLTIINEVAKIYPEDNFVDYTCKILGKPLGILISFGFIIKIMIGVAMEVRIFSEILKEIMLFNTPFWVISFSMLLLGSYMASKGYEARGRIAEILIFIVFLPLAFVFFIAVFDIDFSNLKPFFKEIKPIEALKGGGYMLFYFTGIDFIFLVYPYIKEKEKIKKATIGAITIVGIIMTIITLITIARFGKYDIMHQMWPVLEIMDTIDLPGSFIERQDALIMTFWIISIFMMVNAGMFFSSLIFKDVAKVGTHTTFICICIPIVYFISFLPSNITVVYKIMDIFYFTFGVFYIVILPILLYVVAKVRGLKSENI
ncbi:GerAB/ArcD/ProY family transporter [[Clostridium] colinum]|uniref:GerAB/ArcD/ProY family transporter n=1 Tax=[Clostridium] colinum TaxID=36835 RepID=UPI0020242DE5|nr:endospore germination permease [[Clostridium] colinum]